MTLPVRLNGMRNADLGGEIPVKHGHGSHVEVNYPQIPVKHGHGSHVEVNYPQAHYIKGLWNNESTLQKACVTMSQLSKGLWNNESTLQKACRKLNPLYKRPVEQ